MLTGRVQKLVMTPVFGVYDEEQRLVGEVNGQQVVCYAGQPAPTLASILSETITDQAALERVRAACAAPTKAL